MSHRIEARRVRVQLPADSLLYRCNLPAMNLKVRGWSLLRAPLSLEMPRSGGAQEPIRTSAMVPRGSRRRCQRIAW